MVKHFITCVPQGHCATFRYYHLCITDIVRPSHIITRVSQGHCATFTYYHPCITGTLCDLHILSPSDSSSSHDCLFRLLLPFERRVRGEESKPLPVPYVKPRRAAQAGTAEISVTKEACTEEPESTGKTKPDKVVRVHSTRSFQSDVNWAPASWRF